MKRLTAFIGFQKSACIRIDAVSNIVFNSANKSVHSELGHESINHSLL